MSRLDSLFRLMLQQGSTDLHLAAGAPPKTRTRGALEPVPIPPIPAAEIDAAMAEILDEEARTEFEQFQDVEFSHHVPGMARFRVSYFVTQQGPAAVFRVVPEVPVAIENLALPPAFLALLARRAGIVLVAAPMGSGRSTLHASIVDHLNATSARHILSLEEPIELYHARKQGLVVQREVGRDTESFESGLRAAVRSDADVLVVGDLPDVATTFAALEAAEAGRLVVAFPAFPGAVRTLERLVEGVPPERQGEARALLADNLLGVLGQVLARRNDLPTRIAAHELVLNTRHVSDALRDGEMQAISSAVEAGKQTGMRLLDDSLAALLQQGVISREEAHRRAIDKSRFG